MVLNVYNVNWDARAKIPATSLFHNIGSCQVLANTEQEAYNYTMESLNIRFRRSLDWVNVKITLVEELAMKAGVLDHTEPKYGDLVNKGEYKINK